MLSLNASSTWSGWMKKQVTRPLQKVGAKQYEMEAQSLDANIFFSAQAITDMIGYPEYILKDKPSLNKKYEDLDIDQKTSYFENVLRSRKFVQIEEMKKLSKPVNR